MRMAARERCSLCQRFIICSCGGCASDKGTCRNACPHERSSGQLAAISGQLGVGKGQHPKGRRKPSHMRLDQLDGDRTD